MKEYVLHTLINIFLFNYLNNHTAWSSGTSPDDTYEIGEWGISSTLYPERVGRPGINCICVRIMSASGYEHIGSLYDILSSRSEFKYITNDQLY